MSLSDLCLLSLSCLCPTEDDGYEWSATRRSIAIQRGAALSEWRCSSSLPASSHKAIVMTWRGSGHHRYHFLPASTP